MQKDNVQKPSKGLYTDINPLNQPKDTYRFALNAVSESNEGEATVLSNENSNEECIDLPTNYVPIGKVYVGDNQTVLFLVSTDDSSSEIGLMDNACNYTTLVNDSAQETKLGFKLTQQIDAVYRLRRGCEKTIYWTDPTPRSINLGKLDAFKDSSGDWDIDKFNLFKTYSSIPLFEDIEVEENGNLKPGSYNASIQYLDADLNPTEWITTCEPIKIYNDRFSKNYSLIRGSTSIENGYQEFGETNKSIKFTFSNLDEGYPFYRVAIIESNNGSGQVSAVKYSQEISTEVKVYSYTGAAESEGTEEEIKQFNSIIDSAQHIEQIENRLILAGTKGKQIKYCNLQKYASRIKADLTTKTVLLNALSESNPKTPTINFDGTGYMPGEIYSFGIVYIFEDNTLSPVYHIPGKNPATINTTFRQDPDILPMSVDNTLENTFYTDNSSCGDYWGLDSEGQPLINQPVRHHRFPLRSELNKPLFKVASTTENLIVNQLSLEISGEIDAAYTGETIEYVVEYEIEGNITLYEGSINVETYDPLNGITIDVANSISAITVNNIYENGVAVATPSANTALTYSTAVTTGELDIDDKVYTAEIFGINFSGIDIPPSEELGGEKIIGYYIVRNERDEENKTILDTGVLAPLLEEPYFVAHGHIFPKLVDNTKVKNDTVALIHPEHRFGNRQYSQTTEIIKEGEFRVIGDPSRSSVRTEDVMAGTSYDPEVARRRDRDSDGFSLHTLTRDNEVEYRRVEGVFGDQNTIEDIFYLDALNSKVITDTDSMRKEIFNVSSDNKIGIVQLNQTFAREEVLDKLPYVVMRRKLTDPYSSFRVKAFYKENQNRIPFIQDPQGNVTGGGEVSVFNGDTYITPMRYTSSVFYDIRLRKRESKKGILNIILGALAVIAGVILTIYGGGVVGIALIGFGVSQIATGIEKDQISQVYGELYEAGLRDCVDDDDTTDYFGHNPPDDEIQWLADTATNLWFESTANMALRQGASKNIPDFLNAPANRANPGESELQTLWLPWGLITVVNSADSPQNELDSYILEKLTILDSENENGRLYQGFTNAELYQINPDYRRTNKQKVYFHLGLEYDCCSECQEDFPSRVHWSEQSFQEELTDNYRTFLPNNYRDIEGEQGTVQDLFRIQNNLYIHTEEALWHLPQNIQERVTNQIVSFIGTGDFFSIPPRKIVDDSHSSAGTSHKWATLKTRNGVFFICEEEGKVYEFNGESLKPISDLGMFSHFKNNLPLNVTKQYYEDSGREFKYDNNPSNPFGVGFVATYDTRKERILFSKKDYVLSNEVTQNSDYDICILNGQMILFEDISQTIATQEGLGYTYEGVEDCRLKFSRVETIEVEEPRNEISVVPNNLDIHIFYDTSGSFGQPALDQIDAAVEAWLVDFGTSNPDWTGNVYKYNDGTERWVSFAETIAATTYGGVTADKDILVISFVNEAEPHYHGTVLTDPLTAPTQEFLDDYDKFVGTNVGGNNPGLTSIYTSYNSFTGIHYPIVFSERSDSKEFLLHSLAALKGVSYTPEEIVLLSDNPGLSDEYTEQQTIESALQGPNPYPDDGLENYGWLIKEDRFKDENGNVISSAQFQDDINILLEGSLEVTPITVTTTQQITNYIYIDGTPVVNPVTYNKSWTMSYSLKDKAWISWHSYLPNFYVQLQDEFYAYKGNNKIYRHNKENSFQTFFGNFSPYIIEYVSVPTPLTTKTWNHLRLQTEAQIYDNTNKQYVEERFRTFNKAILYNTRQCSGLMDLRVKDTFGGVGKPIDNIDYMSEQVVNTNNNVIMIDRNEKDWTLNDLRDIRIDYSTSIWKANEEALENDYFIDKVLNEASLDVTKDWTQLESFRDKYLVIRLIFDTFANTKLLTNYSVENEQQSFR